MAQAPTYTPATSFYDDARNNAGGRDAVRTDRLDAELDAIEITTDALCASLELIQRDDGKLRDQIVEPYALSVSALALIQGSRFIPRGLWATGISYAVGDLVDVSGGSYVCAIAHTSNVFATDYAAGRWQAFTSSSSASGSSFNPTTNIPATDVQTAIETVDANARAASSPLLATLFGGL